MSENYKGFASPDEIAHWRVFVLIDGWEAGGNFGVEDDEICLFDSPIIDSMNVSENIVCIRKG